MTSTSPRQPEWMTTQEVADYLRVSLRQVPRLNIRHSMVGRLPRYAKTDVDAFLEHSAVVPGEPAQANGRPRKAAHRFRSRQLDDVEARLAKLKRRR